MIKLHKLNFKSLKKISPFERILALILIPYLLFRPLLTSTIIGFLLIIVIVRTLSTLIPLDLSLLKRKFNIKISAIFIASTYLLLSTFNYRRYSSDGLTFSYKLAYFIKENPVLSFINQPPKPFLFEYISGLLWKFSNMNLLNFLMGAIGILAIYSSYKLLKTIKPQVDKLNLFLYLLLTCVNPVFISLLLFQFKPDLLAYSITCFIFINYIKLFRENSLKSLYFLGILAGIVVVIKVLYIIVIFPIIMMCLIRTFNKVDTSKAIKHVFLFGMLTIAPTIIWLTIFGFTIPKFEKTLSFPGYIQSNTLKLPYDTAKFEICNQTRVLYDYSGLIQAPPNIYAKIFQPWFYIQRNIGERENTLSLGEPGILIYTGLFLFAFFKVGSFKNNPFKIWIYIPMVFALILYYITVANAFWYILFAFPFSAVSLLDFAKAKLRPAAYNLLSRGIFIYSAVLIVFAIGAWLPSLTFKWGDLTKEGVFKGQADLTSYVVDKYTEDSIIFDATIHPHFIFYPFAKNSYSKVYVNPYYFASTGLDNTGIKDELLSNNIGYIVAIKSKLEDPRWYTGCLLENNKKLDSFLNGYTEAVPIPGTTNPYLYKIRD